MTEDEAVGTLFNEFTAREGFLARLRSGDGIDREGVDRMWAALDALAPIWAARGGVSREAMLALTYVDDAIASCYEQNAELSEALFDLNFQMYERIERVLFAALPNGYVPSPELDAKLADHDYWERWSAESVVPDYPLNEDEAIEVIAEHLGGAGLIVALRCDRAGLDTIGVEKAGRLIHMAFDTLGPVWATQQYLAPEMAYWLATMRFGILNAETFYRQFPGAWQRLVELADDLQAHLRRCLRMLPGEQGYAQPTLW